MTRGLYILGAAIVLTILNGLRIDASSHSASDTLMNFVPQTILIFVIAGAVYGMFKR